MGSDRSTNLPGSHSLHLGEAEIGSGCYEWVSFSSFLARLLLSQEFYLCSLSTPPLPTQVLGLKAILGLVKDRCSQEPRDRGRWGLELLPKETYLLQSQQLQSCLETERTPVIAQHWPSPWSLLLSQWEGFPGVGWDHRRQQSCVALSDFTEKSDFAGIRGGWTRVQNSVMLQRGRGTCLEKVSCCSLNLTHFGIIFKKKKISRKACYFFAME